MKNYIKFSVFFSLVLSNFLGKYFFRFWLSYLHVMMLNYKVLFIYMKARLSSTVTANKLTPKSVHPLAVGRSWPTTWTPPLSTCTSRTAGTAIRVGLFFKYCMLMLDSRCYTHLGSAAYAQQALRCPPTQLTLASPRNVKCSVFTLGGGKGVDVDRPAPAHPRLRAPLQILNLSVPPQIDPSCGFITVLQESPG